MYLILNWCLTYISILASLGKLRQENVQFKASLTYIARLCLNNNKIEALKPPKQTQCSYLNNAEFLLPILKFLNMPKRFYFK